MVQISIIIPIHNSEKYLKQCIDSILNQTFQDYEIILVNDCSLDHSEEIMNLYMKKVPDKIICINTETNVRAGGARELGIKNANGKYIMFVDSDDYVSPYICEKLFDKIEEENSDIVFCDHYKVINSTNEQQYYRIIFKQDTGFMTKKKRKSLLLSIPGMCAKLFKKSIFFENIIPFANHVTMGEELVTMHLSFLYAKKTSKIDEALYYYRIHDESSMHIRNDESIFTLSDSEELDYKLMCERGFYKDFSDEIIFNFIKYYYAVMLEECISKFDILPLKFMYLLRKKIRERKIEYKKNKYYFSMLTPYQRALVEWNDVSPEYLKQKLIDGEVNTYSYKEYYKIHIDKIIKLWRKNQNKKIAIWGAGAKGKDFLETLKLYNLNVNFVVDKNTNLHGLKLSTGHYVNSFENIKAEVEIIIIVNIYFYGAVSKMIGESSDIELINLDYILIFE